MRKLIVAYRENALFQKYVPDILSRIPAGVDVGKIIFPAGTSIEDIKKELATRLGGIDVPFLYLSDNTCSFFRAIDEELRKKLWSNKVESRYLDGGFKKEVSKVFETRDFVTIFQDIAQMINKKPSLVCVVAEKITAHLTLPDFLTDTDELGAKYGGNWHEFAEFLKNILEQLYPDTEVHVGSYFSSALNLQEQNTLVVVDRHAMGRQKAIDIDTAATKLFVLPFESAVEHLIGSGKIEEQLDSSALYENIFTETDFA